MLWIDKSSHFLKHNITINRFNYTKNYILQLY